MKEELKCCQLGLTDAEAQRRASDGQANVPPRPLTKTTAQIVRDNVCTWFNLLFAVLGACLAAVGAYREMLFLLVVVCNALVGIVQELRVRSALNKISLVSARTARAVRGGRTVVLPTEQLVLGDLVELAPGDEVCADAVVADGSIEVNESLVTGEADAVAKGRGDELLSGSFVVSGTCRAQLVRVGAASYASGITAEARRARKTRSEMMRSLDAWLRVLGFAIVPLGVLMLTRQMTLRGNSLADAVASTVAAVVGMIPEGLYLLVSAALAVSVVHLARRRTLVRELSCIESLARADVICLDKTGTLTAGKMRVEEVIPCGAEKDELRRLLGGYAAAQSASNATAAALRACFDGAEPVEFVREVPFSSDRKYSALVLKNGGTLVLGAPENVLGQTLAQYEEMLAPFLARGLRVLVLARGRNVLSETDGRLTDAPEPLGFVALRDELRPAAAETIRYFAKQGVEVKIISGDSAAAVSRVAAQAGVEGAERFADLSAVEDDADYAALARSNTVFGRVTPRQKRQLVRAMQADGRFVAMIGDGVNDVLALKDADCSAAMACGADAAQQVSQLVLLDSDFSVMPRIVGEGRRVIHNVSRAASLFLVKNIFSFGLALLFLFLPAAYPLRPMQVGLISFLMIGAPGFLLTFEPAYDRVRGHFLLRALLHALPGGLADISAITAVALAGGGLGWSADQTGTVCVYVACAVGLTTLAFLCSPFTRFRAAVLCLMAAGVVVCSAALPWFFGLVPLTGAQSAALAAACAGACALQCVLVRLARAVRLRLDEAERAPRAGARQPA